MLTTAKSIQLLDASGMNISPITDITSLYYEVENPNNQGIISRKYIYDEFPIGVDINPNTEVSIGTSSGTRERHPENNPLYENGQLYKIVDVSDNNGIIIKKDILVSNVSTYIMKGTTLREIKIKNYNLSEILSYYTPLDLMDASYGELVADISIINASIKDVSNRIANISSGLNTESCTLQTLINLSISGNLVPNKFYLINNYYADGNGCMALPNSAANFSGPNSGSPLSLLVKASDSTNLDGKLYEMYNNSGNALKVYGTYKLEDSKVRITYMKDQYGNEAPYDFYNLKYNRNYTFGTNSINPNIQNNIIKTDPYTFKSMPNIINNSNLYIIKNNYIGHDVSLYIGIPENDGEEQYQQIINNIIGNNNIIKIETFRQSGIYLNISNCKICNFNIINIDTGQNGPILFKNIIINSNNNINSGIDTIYDLSLITINSSNNITLYNNASNVTILNNCDGSINLSDNIIIDNYIDTTQNVSLNTSVNSVYLFGQNIYAKSFNTLR